MVAIVFTVITENTPFCFSPLLGLLLTLHFPTQKGPPTVNLICAWQVDINISPGCHFSLKTSHVHHSFLPQSLSAGKERVP